MSINMHNERQVVGYVNTVGRGKVPEMLSSNNCHALRNTSSTNHPFPFTLCMKRNVFCFMAKFIESTNWVRSRYYSVLDILYILITFIWVILNSFECDWYRENHWNNDCKVDFFPLQWNAIQAQAYSLYNSVKRIFI